MNENAQIEINKNSNDTLLKALIGIMILLGVFGLIYIKKDKRNEKN